MGRFAQGHGEKWYVRGRKPDKQMPHLRDFSTTKAGREGGAQALAQAASKMVGALASATPSPFPSTSLLLPQATQAGEGMNGDAHVTADMLARDVAGLVFVLCFAGNVVL